jgi:hypothetical protein
MKIATQIKSALIGVALLAFVPGFADASPLTFTLTGDNPGATSATFTLDSHPIPSGQFDVTDSPFFNGVSVSGLGTFVVTFYSAAVFNPAGLTIGSIAGNGGTNLLDLGGPQIYGGTDASPTFSPTLGSPIRLGESLDAHGNVILDYTLTISAAPAVPEPSTWAMLLLGVVGLSLARYTQSRRVQSF